MFSIYFLTPVRNLNITDDVTGSEHARSLSLSTESVIDTSEAVGRARPCQAEFILIESGATASLKAPYFSTACEANV
jgi:hypothetical protein